jgi:predicted enzyme related to lactoylglutathione lyase
MKSLSFPLSALGLTMLLLAGCASVQSTPEHEHANADATNHRGHPVNPMVPNAVQVHYLEIVTPSVDETCALLAEAHGVVFSEPIAVFGNARCAVLTDGGRLAVRAPMRATEQPIVRPYLLVDDIDAVVKAAETAGAIVALPPMEIPGEGTFAIYILGGIEHGLWQL